MVDDTTNDDAVLYDTNEETTTGLKVALNPDIGTNNPSKPDDPNTIVERNVILIVLTPPTSAIGIPDDSIGDPIELKVDAIEEPMNIDEGAVTLGNEFDEIELGDDMIVIATEESDGRELTPPFNMESNADAIELPPRNNKFIPA